MVSLRSFRPKRFAFAAFVLVLVSTSAAFADAVFLTAKAPVQLANGSAPRAAGLNKAQVRVQLRDRGTPSEVAFAYGCVWQTDTAADVALWGLRASETL
jgi:hypothetical protein